MKTFERVLIAVVVLVVGVPVVLAGGLAVWLHFASAPPDIHRQIKSADFEQRHTAAVADTDQAAVTFFGAAPHGTRLATAVRDQCTAETGSFGAKPVTSCNREVVLFMAFDGDRATVEHAWRRNLAAAGWIDHDPDVPSDL